MVDSRPYVMYAGDRLSISLMADSISGLHPAVWGATVRINRTGETKSVVGSYNQGPLLVASEAFTITDAILLVDDTVRRVPIEITRSGK